MTLQLHPGPGLSPFSSAEPQRSLSFFLHSKSWRGLWLLVPTFMWSTETLGIRGNGLMGYGLRGGISASKVKPLLPPGTPVVLTMGTSPLLRSSKTVWLGPH